ncbi:MAG: PAS domain-containing protein [Bryobacterales bacterium]|nr:PAS domain-containing protein [Bryobacterales bacterium]
MRHLQVRPTGVECFFGEDEIIVSKTDRRGIITYANDVFQRVSGYRESELLGQPHNLIRHPEMPQSVFKYLWQTIAAGQEIFAYVVNQARNGDHYWVFAHVTPTFDKDGSIVGYHSNRRVPAKGAVAVIQPIYAAMQAEERRHPDPQAGMAAALNLLTTQLQQLDVDYEQFVFSLEKEEAACRP